MPRPRKIPRKIQTGRPIQRSLNPSIIRIRVAFASPRAISVFHRHGLYVREKGVASVKATLNHVEWFGGQGGRIAIIHVHAPIQNIQLVYFEKGARIYHWRDFAGSSDG